MASIEFEDVTGNETYRSEANPLIREVARHSTEIAACINFFRSLWAPDPSTGFQHQKDKIFRNIARNDPISLTML